MGPNPGVDFCGVHVAEVAALGGVPPLPPQGVPPTCTTEEGRAEGIKGCGHGAIAAKNFLMCAGAAAASATTAAAATEEGAEQQGERKRKKGRDWRDRGNRIPVRNDLQHACKYRFETEM
jgi:hypothetical protein